MLVGTQGREIGLHRILQRHGVAVAERSAERGESRMAVANVPIRVAFQNLLVATDFSAHNHSALRYAAAIARKAQGKVYVAHVLSPSLHIGPEDLHPALCQTRRNAERKMASVLKSAELRDVRTEAVLK